MGSTYFTRNQVNCKQSGKAVFDHIVSKANGYQYQDLTGKVIRNYNRILIQYYRIQDQVISSPSNSPVVLHEDCLPGSLFATELPGNANADWHGLYSGRQFLCHIKRSNDREEIEKAFKCLRGTLMDVVWRKPSLCLNLLQRDHPSNESIIVRNSRPS